MLYLLNLQIPNLSLANSFAAVVAHPIPEIFESPEGHWFNPDKPHLSIFFYLIKLTLASINFIFKIFVLQLLILIE